MKNNETNITINKLATNEFTDENSQIINCSETLYDFSIASVNSLDSVVPLGNGFKICVMPLNETQGSLPWCAAYASARIFSYVTGKTIYARDIMKYMYPTETSSQLESRGIYNSEIITYGFLAHGLQLSYKNRTLSNSEVTAQLDRNSPIHIGMVRSSGEGHAMALYGYSPDIYSVWNPWYEYGESISNSTLKYYTTSGTVYTWKDSIINYRN